jgi:nucleotide-binding universal stress UspA family protein
MRASKFAVDIYGGGGVTHMFDCIYGRRGCCMIKRNMTCDADCSYYVEREPDEPMKIVDEEESEKETINELKKALEGVAEIVEGVKPMEEIIKEAAEKNKQAMKEIQRAFRLFIRDLREKYIVEIDKENKEEIDDNIGGTE